MHSKNWNIDVRYFDYFRCLFQPASKAAPVKVSVNNILRSYLYVSWNIYRKLDGQYLIESYWGSFVI